MVRVLVCAVLVAPPSTGMVPWCYGGTVLGSARCNARLSRAAVGCLRRTRADGPIGIGVVRRTSSPLPTGRPSGLPIQDHGDMAERMHSLVRAGGSGAASAGTGELFDAHGGHGGHLAEAAGAGAGGGVGRLCRGRGRRGVDVLAVYVAGFADEGRALLAAGVALLQAVELEACRRG